MYRTMPKEPPKPIGRANDVSTPTIITINDGALTRLAFPCFYAYRKDGEPMPYHRMPPIRQDHYGWPRPDQRDHSFQPQLIESLVIEPIHLEQEGYGMVTFAVNPDIAQQYIDDGVLSFDSVIDDNVVRVHIESSIGWSLNETLEIPFILAVIADTDDYKATDVITSGIVRILPTAGNVMIGGQS